MLLSVKQNFIISIMTTKRALRLHFAIGVLSTLALLTGCVPNRIYRPGPAAIETSPAIDGIPGGSHFKLAAIEFDDMGEAWEKCASISEVDSCQLSRTVDLIRTEKQRAGEVVVVVFIHGWKNNASKQNEEKKNLHDFKIVMERLSRAEAMSVQGVHHSPAYVGVYMAWRGQAVAGDLFATFWNRRDAAQRVGSTDFAESLYRIMGATKENSPSSRIVIVGHSFGARVLETALTNTFVSLLIPRPGGDQSEQLSPADLVVYVNPATDSFRTKQMIELMQRTGFDVARGQTAGKSPLFLSVTSVGDTATGVAFPLGQGLSAASKSFRSHYEGMPLSPPQKTFFTHTPGHIPYLFSHEVHNTQAPCVSEQDMVRFHARGTCFELAPRSSRWNDTAFWVTTVPKQVIRDHTDIFNDGFATMIIELMKHYQVLDSPQATTMLHRQ
jgi:hypothetical protein